MSSTRMESSEVGALADSPQQSFEQLMRPHLRRLYRLAFRLTGASADAEDLLQDVLLRLFERANELSSITDLRPWTSRVLYNCFVDQRRRARTRRLRPAGPDSSHLLDVDEVQHLATSAPGPEDCAALDFEMRQLDSVLPALSDDQRTLLMLHDAEGCTLNEIAAMTGSPIGTLKSRLHRARARLRQLWDDGTFSG